MYTRRRVCNKPLSPSPGSRFTQFARCICHGTKDFCGAPEQPARPSLSSASSSHMAIAPRLASSSAAAHRRNETNEPSTNELLCSLPLSARDGPARIAHEPRSKRLQRRLWPARIQNRERGVVERSRGVDRGQPAPDRQTHRELEPTEGTNEPRNSPGSLCDRGAYRVHQARVDGLGGLETGTSAGWRVRGVLVNG